MLPIPRKILSVVGYYYAKNSASLSLSLNKFKELLVRRKSRSLVLVFIVLALFMALFCVSFEPAVNLLSEYDIEHKN
jgi:hypothetical protein